jgi:SpoVK/Ycf46/Vps4 family AAA+-type ATPase
LFLRGVLTLDHRHPDEPPSSAGLRLSPDWLQRILTGTGHDPLPSHDFPAQRITTPLEWSDLVLDPPVRQQIDVLGRWIVHSRTLLDDWGLAKRLKPGYRCLFHGPPGTGKTLTACLLGKRHGMPVYRVDLSQVVSKWIGETEKNLAALFDRAVHHQWILFFDEADALFGKRTEVRSSNDRSANQQVAYLLQRIEDFPGIVILASNLQAAMDEAFMRRFQSSVLFAMPGAASRLALWRETFRGRGFTLEPGFSFETIAARHEVAGGTIVNVLRHAALAAVERDPPVILGKDILLGLRQELQKDA